MRAFSINQAFSRSLFLVCLFSLLIALPLSAQKVPLEAYFEPEPQAVGDLVGPSVYYGTQAEPVGGKGVGAITLHLAYEGFELDPESQMYVDMKGSWFGTNADVSSTISIDPVAKVIVIRIQRIDGEPQTGYGYLLGSGGGMVIEIDNIHKRQPLWLTKVTVERPAPFTFDHQTSRLQLDADLAPGTPVYLLDGTGRMWPCDARPGQPFDLRHLPAQLYYLRIGDQPAHKLPLYH